MIFSSDSGDSMKILQGLLLVAAGGTALFFAAPLFAGSGISGPHMRTYTPHRKTAAVKEEMEQEAPSGADGAAEDTDRAAGSAAFSGEGEGFLPGDGTAGTKITPIETISVCDFADWVGKPVDQEAVDATKRPFRILPPGAMATMDHITDRLNIHTDEDGIVTSVTCG